MSNNFTEKKLLQLGIHFGSKKDRNSRWILENYRYFPRFFEPKWSHLGAPTLRVTTGSLLVRISCVFFTDSKG